MIFENKRFVGKAKLMRLLLLIGLGAVIVIIATTQSIDRHSFGLGRFAYVALVCVIYIAISLYRFARNYCYLYYSDEDNLLEIRYYQAVMFGSKYRMIRIPFAQLTKYEITTTFLKKELVLFQKDNSGKVAKYDGISVTALESKELEVIIASIESNLNITPNK